MSIYRCDSFCRYPPVPKYPPIAFYSAIRLGDPEQLAKIMDTDPYFITQDNGAGAPVHFATTYKQLDMVSCAATSNLISPNGSPEGCFLIFAIYKTSL